MLWLQTKKHLFAIKYSISTKSLIKIKNLQWLTVLVTILVYCVTFMTFNLVNLTLSKR